MSNSSSSVPPLIWLFLALACIVGYLTITQPTFEHSPGVGKKVDDFALATLTDPLKIVKLSDIREPVVLLNFWGTWCPPCRAELPELVELKDKLKGDARFRLLAVSCGNGGEDDLGDIRQETSAYLTQEKMDLTSYADPVLSARSKIVPLLGGRFGYPTTVLLDKDRVIRAVWPGYAPTYIAEMEREIKTLLADAELP